MIRGVVNPSRLATAGDRGALRITDPLPLISEHDLVLCAASASDMADDAFADPATQQGKAAGPWKMLASKVPRP
jgi:hypothetical protein